MKPPPFLKTGCLVLAILLLASCNTAPQPAKPRIALVMNGGFRIGTVDEIMSSSVLSGMYGIPVDVDSVNGHRIVVARRDGQLVESRDV